MKYTLKTPIILSKNTKMEYTLSVWWKHAGPMCQGLAVQFVVYEDKSSCKLTKIWTNSEFTSYTIDSTVN